MTIRLNNVSKTYVNRDKAVLKNVSLEIRDGEFVCVTGKSGCGKSTLLNLIAGLEIPDQGMITMNDKVILGPGRERTVMFQENALFPWLNTIENVCFGMDLMGLPKNVQEQRAMLFLKMVRLEDCRDDPVHHLSGGMKQRVALARAFATESEVFLMDEPFSALDKQTANALRDQLQDIWMKTRKTILFITHSAEEAVFLADRVIVMSGQYPSIRKIIDIDIKRPRRVYDEGVVALRHQILDLIHEEDY